MKFKEESNGCPNHRGYDSARPPLKGCKGCWSQYNLDHDLPPSNRLARSKFKNAVRVSNRIPDMSLIQFGKDGKIEDSVWLDLIPRGIGIPDPICMGIDVSLTATAAAFISEKDGEWFVTAIRTGLGLAQDDSYVDQMSRMLIIVKDVVRFYGLMCQGQKGVPILIEDHAFSKSSNKLALTHELHGILKMQLHLASGMYVEPLGIGHIRSEVFCHGSPPKPVKKSLKNALVAHGGQAWSEEVDHNVVDAWAVASVHVKRKHPFGSR